MHHEKAEQQSDKMEHRDIEAECGTVPPKVEGWHIIMIYVHVHMYLYVCVVGAVGGVAQK